VIQIALYGLLALALMGAVGGVVWKIDDNGFQRAEAKCAKLAATQREKEQAASSKAAAALQAERKKRKVVKVERTVYVDQIVEKPVYRNVCFEPHGVSCVNSAIKGESAAGCKLDRGMPGIKPPG
jgi:hypothetical protein